MAQDWYIGVDNKARRIVKAYLGVDGKAREITGGYVGVDGKAREFWSGIGDLVYKEASWPRYGVRHGIALTNHIIWGGAKKSIGYCAYDKNFTWIDISNAGTAGIREELGRAGNYVFMVGGSKRATLPGGASWYFMSPDFSWVSSSLSSEPRAGCACATLGDNGYAGFGVDVVNKDTYGITKISPDLTRSIITMTTAVYKAETTGAANDNYVMFFSGMNTGSKPSSASSWSNSKNISYVDKNDIFGTTDLPTTPSDGSYRGAVYFDKRVVAFTQYVYTISNDMVVTNLMKTPGYLGKSYLNCVATRGHIVSNGSGRGTNKVGDSDYDYAKMYYWLDKNMVYGSAQRDTRGVGKTWGCGYWQGRAMFNACDHNESSGSYYGGKMYTFKD